jgi:hypothetical protein
MNTILLYRKADCFTIKHNYEIFQYLFNYYLQYTFNLKFQWANYCSQATIAYL